MNRPIGSHLYREKTVEITKSPSDGTGRFEGYASTWRLDRDNEKFRKGAFLDSIVRWMAAGDMPPLGWNHQLTNDPINILGVIESMSEDDRGLKISARLDLTNPRAVKAYEAMLGGALKTMSIGFIGEEWHFDGDVRVFTKAEVLEVSLAPVPSNIGAQVTAVKNAKDARAEASQRMRTHLRASHAWRVRAVSNYPMPDLVLLHRVMHAGLGDSPGERHLTTGSTDAGVTIVQRSASRAALKSSDQLKREVARLHAYEWFAEQVRHDRLVRVGNKNAEIKTRTAYLGSMTLEELKAAEEPVPTHAVEPEQQRMVEDFNLQQREQDRQAVEELLSPGSETFTMRIDESGTLRDA